MDTNDAGRAIHIPSVEEVFSEMLSPQLFYRWLQRKAQEHPSGGDGRLVTYLCELIGTGGALARDAPHEPFYFNHFDGSTIMPKWVTMLWEEEEDGPYFPTPAQELPAVERLLARLTLGRCSAVGAG
jgi:hypothetical protein